MANTNKAINQIGITILVSVPFFHAIYFIWGLLRYTIPFTTHVVIGKYLLELIGIGYLFFFPALLVAKIKNSNKFVLLFLVTIPIFSLSQ